LCVVDDAHWLDRASADALQFAARRLGSEGVVLLASAREDGFEAPGLPELTLGRLGREASRALLAERAPGLPPALADRVLAEAAERSGLIVVRASKVAFRHPLVRAAVYQGATSAERGAAHAALAGALDDPLAGEPDADRRAWHLAAAAAGPDERVAAALEQAADRARQRLGHAAPAAAPDRAARLTPAQPDRARRLIAAAGAALDAGRPDAAAALAGQGLSLTTEPGALAEIARVRAWVAMERGAMHRVHE